ncbi:uncharacterized protein UTRI_02442 [Ustilago trichophora]|uniref:Translation elongation factor EFTs/EF1B dimerisation domain-containing protein n=1 Tax=Ustilago trichophora TaxID=86804 RepID=A0A5C3E9C7_9BASI|nr:uncharacterized protein UTRI_02442 [Ustilago trichophora]
MLPLVLFTDLGRISILYTSPSAAIVMISSSATVLRSMRIARLHPPPISSSQHAFARTFSRSALVAAEPKKPSIKPLPSSANCPRNQHDQGQGALLPRVLPLHPIKTRSHSLWNGSKQIAKSRRQEGDKVAGRQAREGVVAVTVLSDGLPSSVELKGSSRTRQRCRYRATSAAAGGIVEVNCETDFVAKNEFSPARQDIVHTVALFPTLASETKSHQGGFVAVPVEELLAFPLLPSSPEAQGSSVAPKTVGSPSSTLFHVSVKRSRCSSSCYPSTFRSFARGCSQVRDGHCQGGSIVDLASAFAMVDRPVSLLPRTNKPGYVSPAAKSLAPHDPFRQPQAARRTCFHDGSIQTNIRALTRSLARQVAGMETKSINTSSSATPQQQQQQRIAVRGQHCLYQQPFMMLLPAAAPSPESNSQSSRCPLVLGNHNKLDGNNNVSRSSTCTAGS